MPKVGTKCFSYKRMDAARKEARRTGQKIVHGTVQEERVIALADIVRRQIQETTVSADARGLPTGFMLRVKRRKKKRLAEAIVGRILREAAMPAEAVNDLPDSAFLYIAPGGTKDDSGRTVPRSKRHFPVRKESGEIDKAHLRNALARIPQSNLSGALKRRSKRKAVKLAKEVGIVVDGE